MGDHSKQFEKGRSGFDARLGRSRETEKVNLYRYRELEPMYGSLYGTLISNKHLVISQLQKKAGSSTNGFSIGIPVALSLACALALNP